MLLHPHRNQPVFAYNVPSLTVSFSVIMPKVTSYTSKRIPCLHKEGFYPVQILKASRRENLQGSLASVTGIINKIQKIRSTENRPRSGRPTELPADAKAFLENAYKRRGNKHPDSKTTGQAWTVVNSTTVRRSQAK